MAPNDNFLVVLIFLVLLIVIALVLVAAIPSRSKDSIHQPELGETGILKIKWMGQLSNLI